MRIGEAAARSGGPARLLRYEDQGLPSPRRYEHGGRVYDEPDLAWAREARGLLAGLLVSAIRRLVGHLMPDGPQGRTR